MTATDSPFDRPERRRPLFDAAMWLGHHSARRPALFAGIAVATIAKWWAGELPPVFTALSILLSLIYLALWTSEILFHDRNLCLRCVEDAPLLDPQAAVEQNIGLLRFAHHHWRYTATALLGFAPVALLFVPESAPLYVRVLLTGLAIAGVCGFIYAARAFQTHRRLQTWCPWCRDHRGPDDDAPETVPTPDPVGKAHI